MFILSRKTQRASDTGMEWRIASPYVWYYFDLIVVMKKHGSNTENISYAVLRLGTKLWWRRAPLTFLHVKNAHEYCFGLLLALKAA